MFKEKSMMATLDDSDESEQKEEKVNMCLMTNS